MPSLPAWLLRPSAPTLVALLVALVSALTSVGNLSSDPFTRYLVAESIMQDGDVELEQTTLTVPGGPPPYDVEAGPHYSVFFPGQTLVMLPAAALAEIGRRLAPGSEEAWRAFGCFVAAVLITPAFAGFATRGHVALLERLGAGLRTACAGGLLLGLATVHWVWASAGSEEVIVGALGTWTMVCTLDGARHLDRDRIARAARAFGFAGLMMAGGMLHRGTFLPFVLASAALGLPAIMRLGAGSTGRLLGRLAPWFVASSLLAAVLPAYNWIRFGDLMETGYGRFYAELGGLWAQELHLGLIGHMVSPGKSIFLYTPVLLLTLPALCSAEVRRRLAPIGPALAVAVIAHFIVYSKHTFWAGAFGWAVRFHVSMMPLMLLPVSLWLGRHAGRAVGVRRATLGLIAASVLVQVIGWSLNTGLETKQDPDGYAPHDHRLPEAAAWTWAQSPFRLRLVNLHDKILGPGIEPPGGNEAARIMTVWNIFPVRAGVAMADRPVVIAGSWAAWFMLAGATGATAWQLRRRWPTADAGPASADVRTPA